MIKETKVVIEFSFGGENIVETNGNKITLVLPLDRWLAAEIQTYQQSEGKEVMKNWKYLYIGERGGISVV